MPDAAAGPAPPSLDELLDDGCSADPPDAGAPLGDEAGDAWPVELDDVDPLAALPGSWLAGDGAGPGDVDPLLAGVCAWPVGLDDVDPPPVLPDPMPAGDEEAVCPEVPDDVELLPVGVGAWLVGLDEVEPPPALPEVVPAGDEEAVCPEVPDDVELLPVDAGVWLFEPDPLTPLPEVVLADPDDADPLPDVVEVCPVEPDALVPPLAVFGLLLWAGKMPRKLLLLDEIEVMLHLLSERHHRGGWLTGCCDVPAVARRIGVA